MRIHYLQHVPFENPGHILTWAARKGHDVTATHLYLGQMPPGMGDFDWLVVMGGPMNVYEEESCPWLRTEKAFILQAVRAGKIVLGLCLGAQLITDVLGGKVTKNEFTEIGWFPVRLGGPALSSGLFSFLPEEPVVFQWHGDTFSELPQGAVCIAGNDVCEHQAFTWGNRVFGFQFHLENTPEIIGNLIRNCAKEMAPGPYVQSAESILAHPEHIRQDNLWMEQFLSRLETEDAGGKI